MFYKMFNSALASAQMINQVLSHKSPSDSWTSKKGSINIFDCSDSSYSHINGFSPDGGLQAIGDVTGYFFLEYYYDLSELLKEMAKRRSQLA